LIGKTIENGFDFSAVPSGKGKLEKLSIGTSSSEYYPQLRHFKNCLSDNFFESALSISHGRQPPLRYPSKTGSSWISGNDVRSGFSTEPFFFQR